MTARDEIDRAERLRRAILLKKKTASRSRPPELPRRPPDEPARLGEIQRGLWLAHEMDPRSPAYHLASAFRVQGALDVAKLQWALDQVVARHRLLRSTFRRDGEDVVQIVHPTAPLPVEVVAADDGEGRATAIREARRPFDLENGPLIRARLVEESSERWLLLVLHHVLADERSLELLWKEIAEAYDGRLSSSEAPIQYEDYVSWLRGRGDDRDGLDFWRRRLDPPPDDLELPFERPAGDVSGRLLTRPVSPAARRGIRRGLRCLAADAGATPFMVLAFAFRLLLGRYAEGRRIAFATPVSTRSHPATATMLGYFLNPVVVVAEVDEGRPLEPALRDFVRELKEALAHASVPFQKLVEELAPRRRDRHPLFQAMFVYQETRPPPELGDARLEPVTLDLGASKLDLTLFVTEGEDALEIAVEYRVDRFDEVWMRNLLGHYATLLEHLPDDLERVTAEVPMLTDEERSRLLADARGAELDTTGTALLPRWIADQAGESPAVVCGGRRSHGELEGAARSIARELSDHGVGPGDRVALFLERSVEMIAGLLGVLRAGAAYVPLDPGYPAARNRDVLEDADVTAVLTTSTLRDRLPAGSWTTIDVDRLAEDTRRPVVFPDLSPEDPAYVLYTSGSTGRPKGVVVTHGNLRASTAARPRVYDASPERFLLEPSLAFDSSVAGLFWTLATGGALVVPTDDEARDARRLARLVARERVTGLLCVPSLYAALLAVDGDPLRTLEIAIVAGESCPPRLVAEHFRRLPDTRLYNEYGPTEATVWATVHEITEDDAAGPVPIGRPIPGVRVEVLDARGRRVPAGIPGLAWIAGPTVARGYWRRPELTAERFVNAGGERRYRTGDRMAWTPDGRLLFLGREDEQIKLRGFRVEPGEIEAALLESPAIERAAVVARPPGPDTRLVAFVEAADTVEGWRQDLAGRLPEHMIPSRLVTLPELPRLPNGKVDRGRLRDLPLDPEAPAAPRRPVVSTREETLLSLWEGLLGRSGVGLDDNFFELGGHSLLVVEMASAVERDFEVSLSVADVFESPTVRELARRIERQGSSSAPYEHLFPIQPAGRGMPFVVAVPHFFTSTFAERFRGERPVYGLRGVSLRPGGNQGRWRTMADLGEELVDEIRRRFPDQTCVIAGYSFGASMAVEAVRIMEERGLPVRRLILIAPMPVDVYRLGPFRVQLDGLRQPLDELSPWEALRLYARANDPLTRRPYARVRHRLGVEPWRRFLCLVGRARKLAGLPLTSRILHADVRLERFRLHARYRPGVVTTPTVIFNAREAETDAAATWRPYFRGPLTVHETPDPHLGGASVDAARRVILDHLQDLEAPDRLDSAATASTGDLQ